MWCWLHNSVNTFKKTTNKDWIIHFKWVMCMVFQLCINKAVIYQKRGELAELQLRNKWEASQANWARHPINTATHKRQSVTEKRRKLYLISRTINSMGYTPRLLLLPEYPIETMNNSFIIPGANLVNNSPEASIYYGNKASANVYVMRGIIAHVMIFRLIIGQLEVAWYTGIHPFLRK